MCESLPPTGVIGQPLRDDLVIEALQRGAQREIGVAEEDAIAEVRRREVVNLEGLCGAIDREDLRGKGPRAVNGRQDRLARAMGTMESSGVTRG